MIITTQRTLDKKIYAITTTKSNNKYITFDQRLISDLKFLATHNKNVKFYPLE